LYPQQESHGYRAEVVFAALSAPTPSYGGQTRPTIEGVLIAQLDSASVF
jgi:hypothetical protein